jgi:hypothetical protein
VSARLPLFTDFFGPADPESAYFTGDAFISPFTPYEPTPATPNYGDEFDASAPLIATSDYEPSHAGALLFPPETKDDAFPFDFIDWDAYSSAAAVSPSNNKCPAAPHPEEREVAEEDPIGKLFPAAPTSGFFAAPAACSAPPPVPAPTPVIDRRYFGPPLDNSTPPLDPSTLASPASIFRATLPAAKSTQRRRSAPRANALTPQDMSELAARRQKNAMQARESRKRKAEHLRTLEREVKRLQEARIDAMVKDWKARALGAEGELRMLLGRT